MYETLVTGLILANFTATLSTAAVVYFKVDALKDRVDKLSDRLLVLETRYCNSQMHLEK